MPLSLADTLTIPLASISKVTSIWGTPLGAGAIPISSKLPSNFYLLPSLFHPEEHVLKQLADYLQQ